MVLSTSISSASFDVTINSDEFTELREFFEAILARFFVSRTVSGPQLTLSEQETSRITIATPSARVYIIDTDSKNLDSINSHLQLSSMCVFLVARIGFDPVEYSVSEDAGTVSFEFGVLEGNIAFDVNVIFLSSNGSAQSNLFHGATSFCLIYFALRNF